MKLIIDKKNASHNEANRDSRRDSQVAIKERCISYYILNIYTFYFELKEIQSGSRIKVYIYL